MFSLPLLRLPLMAVIALAVGGCTTTSKRVIFRRDGLKITQTKSRDIGLQMTGHGGYILITNSASVFGKNYSVLAGDKPCVFSTSDQKFLFFACLVEKLDGTITPDRELHIVDLGSHSDTSIFFGRSRIGDDFGGHKAGSQFSERAEFIGDRLIQITTYDGTDDTPNTKSVFIVDRIEKKLVSEAREPVAKKLKSNESSTAQRASGVAD